MPNPPNVSDSSIISGKQNSSNKAVFIFPHSSLLTQGPRLGGVHVPGQWHGDIVDADLRSMATKFLNICAHFSLRRLTASLSSESSMAHRNEVLSQINAAVSKPVCISGGPKSISLPSRRLISSINSKIRIRLRQSSTFGSLIASASTAEKTSGFAQGIVSGMTWASQPKADA